MAFSPVRLRPRWQTLRDKTIFRCGKNGVGGTDEENINRKRTSPHFWSNITDGDAVIDIALSQLDGFWI
jgi:hypothetical protein